MGSEPAFVIGVEAAKAGTSWHFSGPHPLGDPRTGREMLAPERLLAMTSEQRAQTRAALLPLNNSIVGAFRAVPEAWTRSMDEVAA